MMITTATTLVVCLIVLVIVVACNQDLHVSSFQLFQLDNNHKNHFQLTTTASPRKGTAVSTTLSARADTRQDGDDETTLTLQGKIVVDSNPLPKPNKSSNTNEELLLVSEFFRTKSYRNLLVTGGGERSCTELTVITPQQLQNWKEQCRILDASEPDENDCILSIVTPGIQFPGLKVESLAMIGVKYIEQQEKIDDNVVISDASSTTTTTPILNNNSDNASKLVPRYEYVGLANEQTASGIPPAVWIFNKLTGGGGTENTKFKSLSTVSYFQNNNNKIVFQINAFLSIGISFPKFLLQILPGDKKTIEGRGGKSILKALDKDVQQSMKAFEKAYRNHKFATNYDLE